MKRPRQVRQIRKYVSQPAQPLPDARWIPTARSGRMPITLIDGSTRANAAASIRALAAALHFRRPCYAAMLQRVASQVSDSYTAAQAISNYTDSPTFDLPVPVETTFSEGTFSDAPATPSSTFP